MSRTLAAGRKVGFRCGLGVATTHAIYTSLAVFGADRASGLLDRSAFALHIVGGVLLVALGLRLARRGPVPTSPSTTGAYVTTLAFSLGNPLTILYFAAAMAAGAIPAGTGPLVVIGVLVGSAVWWGVLTSVTAAVSTTPRRALTRMGQPANRIGDRRLRRDGHGHRAVEANSRPKQGDDANGPATHHVRRHGRKRPTTNIRRIGGR